MSRDRVNAFARHPEIARLADDCVAVHVNPSAAFKQALVGMEISQEELSTAIDSAYSRNANVLQRQVA